MSMIQHSMQPSKSPVVLESTLNQDIMKLTQWFTDNCLQVDATKTQAITLGKSEQIHNLSVQDQTIEIESTLKILCFTLDKNLSYKPHIDITLKKGICPNCCIT